MKLTSVTKHSEKKPSYRAFIEGRSIDLVHVDETIVDESNWYKWFNDEDLTRETSHHYFPNTKDAQLEYFKSEIKLSKTKCQYGIVLKENQLLIGMISLNGIDTLNKSCEFSGIIGEKEYQSFKYYTEACELILFHAFENLNMHRVYGGVLNENLMQFCCKVLGFTREGVWRSEVYKNGVYHNAYMFGILCEEYRAHLNNMRNQ